MSDKHFNVQTIIIPGDFEEPMDSSDIIDQAAQVLDSVDAANILSDNLFLGDDGKFYTVTVEACLSEASKWFVNDRLTTMVNDLSDEIVDAEEEGKPTDVLKAKRAYLEGLLVSKEMLNK